MICWILLVFFLFSQCCGVTVGLNQVDAMTACSVLNCMKLCGCQNSHNLKKIDQLRHQCSTHFNATYTNAVRCPDQQRICLCKEDNVNCKRCTKDSSNDLMCFTHIRPSREVSVCKSGRCDRVSTVCGTTCLGCMRPSTTAYPSTRGPTYVKPYTRRPPSGPHLPKDTGGTGSNHGSIPSEPPDGRVGGHNGYNQGPGTDSNRSEVSPQEEEENQTAKIIAIVACTVMLLISCSVFIVVLVKLKQQSNGERQIDMNKENSYATIQERKRPLNRLFSAKDRLRDKLFANQVYDDTYRVDTNGNQASTGPPIPMSDRPFKKSIVNGSRVYPPTTPATTKPSLRHVHSASATTDAINNETPLELESSVDEHLLVGSKRSPLKNIKTEYMSLMKAKKPLPPWKGPHGESYNLEGYTELNNAVANKSNNASTTSYNYQRDEVDCSPPRRTVSQRLLNSCSAEPRCDCARSLPNISFPVTDSTTCPQYPEFQSTVEVDDMDKEQVYYYKVGVNNHTDEESDCDEAVGDQETPYYYSLQDGGDVVVTDVDNSCCDEAVNMVKDVWTENEQGEGAARNVLQTLHSDRV